VATPFKTTGGGNFVLTPKIYSGYTPFLEAFASDGTGPGLFAPIDLTFDSAPYIGAAVDVPNNFVYAIAIKDSDVKPF